MTGWEIFAFQSLPNLLTFEMLLIETDFDIGIGRVYGFVYLIIEIPCCFYLISIQGLFRDLCYIGMVEFMDLSIYF